MIRTPVPRVINPELNQLSYLATPSHIIKPKGPCDAALSHRSSWLVIEVFCSKVISGGHRLVTVLTDSDFIVLPHSEIRPLAP